MYISMSISSVEVTLNAVYLWSLETKNAKNKSHILFSIWLFCLIVYVIAIQGL